MTPTEIIVVTVTIILAWVWFRVELADGQTGFSVFAELLVVWLNEFAANLSKFANTPEKPKRKNDDFGEWAIGDDGEIVTEKEKPDSSYGTTMK